ncbi:hypothetical protein D3C86_2104960 [compost metagenome]
MMLARIRPLRSRCSRLSRMNTAPTTIRLAKKAMLPMRERVITRAITITTSARRRRALGPINSSSTLTQRNG